MLSRIDFSNTKLTLFYKGKKAVFSSFGGLVSLFSCVLLLLLIVAFGRDFYYRTNPYVYFSTLDTGEYQNATISKSNFTLAFRFEDEFVVKRDVQGLSFFFQIFYEEYSRDSLTGEFIMINQTILPYRSCNIEDVYFENFGSKDYRNFYCMDYSTLKIGGFWDSNYVSFFYINYYRCLTTNPFTNETCNSPEITQSFLNNLTYVSYLLPDMYYNHSNYANPITNKVFNQYNILDDSLRKDIYYKLSINQVESDYGWILENKSAYSILIYESHTVDYNINKQPYDDSTYLGSANFYLNKELKINHRIYSKLQGLIANIGGVFKAVTMIISLLSELYNESVVEIDIMSKLGCKEVSQVHLENSTLIKKTQTLIPETFHKNNYVPNQPLQYGSLKPVKVNKIEAIKRFEDSISESDDPQSWSIIASQEIWKYIIFSKVLFCFSKFRLLRKLRELSRNYSSIERLLEYSCKFETEKNNQSIKLSKKLLS